MTQEEKARRYDEALERAKNFHSHMVSDGIRYTVEEIFPELKESEGKRIRKGLIKAVSRTFEGNTLFGTDVTREEALAWLEKQGEKELTESKFKVDDWIISNVNENRPNRTIAQITSIHNSLCYIRDIWGSVGYETLDGLRDNYRLWTIDDAKFGDVLVNGSNIFIFHFINVTRLMGYCHVNTDDGRFYDDIGKNECFCLIDAVVNPATKEQRVLLFQKMIENGYMWDAEKLELKKYKPVAKKEVTGKLKEMLDNIDPVELEETRKKMMESMPTDDEVQKLHDHLEMHKELGDIPKVVTFTNSDNERIIENLNEIIGKLGDIHEVLSKPYVSGTKGKNSPLNSEEEDNEE